jgi:uncharacterized protein YggE
MKSAIFTFLAVLASMQMFGQAAANQVIGQAAANQVIGNGQYYPQAPTPYVEPVHLIGNGATLNTPVNASPNHYLIEANVLYHGIADRYIAVFGVVQEEPTAELANARMNDHIEAFRQDMLRMGIREQDIFVDLITQTRVYDFKMKDANTAEERVTGIELKKNVHVAFRNMNQLEGMMLSAAKQDIYDIVKVDYVLDNIDSIYQQMQASALSIIDQKKRTYMMLEEKKYAGNPLITKYEKGALQPVNAYRQYTAHETNSVAFNQPAPGKPVPVRISARRMKTFYFDPLPEEQFDRVINAYGVEPTVQLTMKLQVRFEVL